jgi:hypothetical protein
VPDGIVLIVRIHPVGSENVSWYRRTFAGEREALEAIAQALHERRSLVLTHARYDREADQNGVIINLANVVSLQVSEQTVRRASTGDSRSNDGERSRFEPVPHPATSTQSSPGHHQGAARPSPGHGLRDSQRRQETILPRAWPCSTVAKALDRIGLG